MIPPSETSCPEETTIFSDVICVNGEIIGDVRSSVILPTETSLLSSWNDILKCDVRVVKRQFALLPLATLDYPNTVMY